MTIVPTITTQQESEIPSAPQPLMTELDPTEDDRNLEDAIIQNHKDEELMLLIDRLDSYRDENIESETEVQEDDPDDPLGIKIWPTLYKGVGALGSDVGRGIVEAPAMVLTGIRDAAQETINAIHSFGEWLNEQVPESLLAPEGRYPPIDPALLEPLKLPEGADPESVTGSTIKSISQFITAWIPFLRGIKSATPIANTTKIGRFAQRSGAAIAVGGIAFDPMEKRLANLLVENDILTDPITQYLATDPNDNEAEARLKSGLEIALLGGVAEGAFVIGKKIIEGLVKSMQVIRNNRIQAGVEPTTPVNTPAKNITEKFGDATGPVLIKGTKEKPLLPLEGDITIAELVIGGQKIKGKLPFRMNWARAAESVDGGETLLRNVAQVFKAAFNEKRRKVLSDKAVEKLARDLNMKPEDILNRPDGSLWKAEEVMAAQVILDASLKETKRFGAIAWKSTDTVDDMIFLKMFNLHVNLQSQYQGAASETGRALRIFQKFGGSTAKQINDLNQILMEHGGPAAVKRLGKAVSELTDPAHFAKIANKSLNARLTDIIIQAWYFNLLSGPITHAVNVTTGVSKMLFAIPQRSLAAQISKLRGTESVQVSEATAMAEAMISNLGTSFRMAWRTLKTGEQEVFLGSARVSTKTDIPINPGMSALGVFGKEPLPGTIQWYVGKFLNGIGKVLSSTQRALVTEDEFFRQQAMAISNRALAVRSASRVGLEGEARAAHIIKQAENPTDEMLEEGLKIGQEWTFLTPMGTTGQAVQAATNRHPILKFVLPFLRTGVNLTKDALTSTPLGLLSRNIRESIVAGGATGDLAISKMIMGSGLSLAFADLTLRGHVTGSGPTDPGLRTTWLQTHRPFSVRMPINVPGFRVNEDGSIEVGKDFELKKGDWVSYNRSDPHGMFLGAAASYAEVFANGDEETVGEYATALSLATSRSVLSKTWMRGPADMLDAMTQPEIYGDKWVQNFIGTLLISTLSKQTASVIDPVWREVNSISDAIYARIPGFSTELNPYQNIWGKDIFLEGGLGFDIVSPFYTSSGENNLIDEWLWENRVPMFKISGEISFPVGGIEVSVELTDDEMYRYRQLAGNELKHPDTELGALDTLNAIMREDHDLSGAWLEKTNGPEGSRAIMVKGIISIFRKLAKEKLIEEFPIIFQRIYARQTEKINALTPSGENQ